MSHEDFIDPSESAAEMLERLAVEGYASITPTEMLEDFVARTPSLTPGERADLLMSALDTQSAAEIDWGRTGADIQSWGQFGQGLAGLGANIAGLIGGRGGRDAQRILQGIGGVGGALTGMTGGLMQQFGRPQPGQVPPIRPGPGMLMPPRPTAPGTAGAPSFPGMFFPPGGQHQAGGQQARAQYQGPPTGFPGGRPGTDATAMLQQLLANPQLLQALAQGVVGGRTAPREVVLELAGTEGACETVAIPLGAVMNAISTLASEAMTELNAQTHEAEAELPSYLMSEGGELIVDPASAEDRAALVVEYFRRAGEAARTGQIASPEGFEPTWEGGFEDDEDDEDDEGFEDDESLGSSTWADFGF